ncbi:NAD-dependent epimerase/dehydratase family protein [Mucilaginibacter sp.]|uniref:NAD-dependent epimerase/dehydratase family protein n=1 Tax=Mucilaginibacter sp. TaxID=1882438 RepID=UPI003B004C5D
MTKVLVTGITGFLGSAIAEKLLSENFDVVGLMRPNSDVWRCKDFTSKVFWVEVNEHWRQNLLDQSPDIIIHCAWMGVGSGSRNNWNEQIKNIEFLTNLLEIGAEISVKKIIFLGSQAEYGRMFEKVNEQKMAAALDAYSAVKLSSLEIVKAFCSLNNIKWVWLRVFSVFGEKEDESWLIPALIKIMQKNNEMDLTEGQQKYAYLYVLDFAKFIHKIVIHQVPSGIYNLSSDTTRSIRSIAESIRDLVNPSFKLNFGAIPYRPNQSMYVEGDISKLTGSIGEIDFTDFELALRKTIGYYLTE